LFKRLLHAIFLGRMIHATAFLMLLVLVVGLLAVRWHIKFRYSKELLSKEDCQRLVIITGGSSGLGLAILLELLKSQEDSQNPWLLSLVILDKKPLCLKALPSSVHSEITKLFYYACDVANPTDLEACCALVLEKVTVLHISLNHILILM
jgi:hypothetical protein